MTLTVAIKHQFGEFTLDASFNNGNNLGVIFGFSGAGKSVTLQMISGLRTPSAGKITLGDRILFDSDKGINIPPGERRIGYLFQDNTLFPHMTVRENILFGGRRLTPLEKNEKLNSLAEKFRISSVLDHFPEAISGGQKKRVALAMALMGDPALLLLDEPFSALDNPLKLRMRECLAGVMKHLPIPVLLVTHDIVEAISMGDAMHVFSAGRVIQSGVPEEILKKPASPEVATLMEIPALPTWFQGGTKTQSPE